MLQGLTHLARQARPWTFAEARNVLARLLKTRLDGDAERDLAATLIDADRWDELLATLPALRRPVVFQCGYGASGLPHVGTFGEAARPTMVRTAFRALTNDTIPTRLIIFSDDMDGLRRIPPNLPHQDWLEADRDKPVTSVRDPFEEAESFGAHNNARARAFFDSFGFDYEFISATDFYRSGRMDAVLLTILERFDAVQAVMLPTLGPDRRATYSPFQPISPTTGRVLYVPTLERHPGRGTIVFQDEDGRRVEAPVTGGYVKLQWRPDWAARWTALGVDFEMSGKDLVDSFRVSAKLTPVLGGAPPETPHYELFMDENNQKISKTKGNGLSMEEWLRYGAPESLAYYMFTSPKTAKRLYFDVIPKATDEYLQHLESYNRMKAEGSNAANPLDNPVWSVCRGEPPARSSPISFSLLLNLVSVVGSGDRAVIWGFLSRYLPGATPESEPMLARLVDYAIHYVEDFVLPAKTYRAATQTERAAFADLVRRLKALPADCVDGEAIQSEVYEAGKAAGFEPLRSWFQALYEVLLGQSQAPRFGSFAAIYGLKNTIQLIEQALSAG
jgi:lysyl-tRNA synthetase class 1